MSIMGKTENQIEPSKEVEDPKKILIYLRKEIEESQSRCNDESIRERLRAVDSSHLTTLKEEIKAAIKYLESAYKQLDLGTTEDEIVKQWFRDKAVQGANLILNGSVAMNHYVYSILQRKVDEFNDRHAHYLLELNFEGNDITLCLFIDRHIFANELKGRYHYWLKNELIYRCKIGSGENIPEFKRDAVFNHVIAGLCTDLNKENNEALLNIIEEKWIPNCSENTIHKASLAESGIITSPFSHWEGHRKQHFDYTEELVKNKSYIWINLLRGLEDKRRELIDYESNLKSANLFERRKINTENAKREVRWKDNNELYSIPERIEAIDYYIQYCQTFLSYLEEDFDNKNLKVQDDYPLNFMEEAHHYAAELIKGKYGDFLAPAEELLAMLGSIGFKTK